ncbi:HERV-H LTR-associating protein 2 isoform X2 [Lithobates pipiens]
MKLLILLQIFRLFLFVHGEVVGELNGIVILPCSFTPGKDELIHWTINNEKQSVHSYYHGKDMLKDQDKSYAGRTSLFLDQIKHGNASLQLKQIQKSDENEYSCYVSTVESKRSKVLLKVKTAVWGELHKNVTIPCSFNPGKEVVIHWRIKSDKSRIVHKYYQGQDRLEGQDKSYKGRTSLILSELTNGNASLQIRELQEGDENTYSCYVGTIKEQNEENVKLNVAATEQNNVECPCRYCKTVDAEMSVRLYIRKNTTEVPVASVNNSSLVIAEDYRSKVQTLEKYSLHLTNLTANDNGDYICEIRTLDGIFISLTSVNITNANENHQRHSWMVILGAFALFCIVSICIIMCTWST